MTIINNRLRTTLERFQVGVKTAMLRLHKLSTYKRWQGRWLLVSVASFIIVVLLATTAWAYTVTLFPTSPQLGATISVRIQPQPGTIASPTAITPAITPAPTATTTSTTTTIPAPTVTLNNTTYPSYLMPGGYFRALVPTSPLDTPGGYTLHINGAEGERTVEFELGDRSFRTQRIRLSPSQSSLGTDHEFERVAAFKTTVTPNKLWNGPLLRPSQGRVSSAYGNRRYYNGVFAEDYYHRGVDYAANTGTPVIAPADGYIGLVGRVQDGFELHGNTIGIDHGQGVLSIMIHLSRIDVSEGDFVEAGQVIGAIGSTGASTGPHLHWGLYVNGVAVDPVPWRFDDGIE